MIVFNRQSLPLHRMPKQRKQSNVVIVINFFVKVHVFDYKERLLFVPMQRLKNLSIHRKQPEVNHLHFVKLDFSDEKNLLAKFVCPNPTCHRELGVVILLLRNTPAYALQITAVKFFFKGEKEPRLYKKWSLYQGYLEPL